MSKLPARVSRMPKTFLIPSGMADSWISDLEQMLEIFVPDARKHGHNDWYIHGPVGDLVCMSVFDHEHKSTDIPLVDTEGRPITRGSREVKIDIPLLVMKMLLLTP